MKKIELFLLCWLSALLAMAGQQSDSFIIQGKITDEQNRPIANVVVNDGINFTTTDAYGMYTLNTDTDKCNFVRISVPAAYELPVNEQNLFRFYLPINRKNNGGYDFKLKKRTSVDKQFTYMVFSDPQPKNDFHFVRFFTETVPDVKAFVAQLKGDVYGFVEGDIVSDALHLYPLYTSAVASWGISLMHVIGNHDFDLKYEALSRVGNVSKKYAEHTYEDYYGPTDYSLNLGDIHVVCMKDIDYMGHKKYNVRFTPEQIEWLRKDLSYVKPGSTIFLNVHAPLFKVLENDADKEVFNLLKDYNVHVFSGHTHYHKNVIMADNIYEHNVGAVCGFHWVGDTSRCGTPNGYMCVEVDGNDVTWHFKPTGHDINYQFKVYKPGQFESQAEYVVANVWDWDSTYQINWYEDEVLKGSMEQFIDLDQDYVKSGRVNMYRTEHLFRAKPSPNTRVVKIEVTNRFGEVYTQDIKLK